MRIICQSIRESAFCWSSTEFRCTITQDVRTAYSFAATKILMNKHLSLCLLLIFTLTGCNSNGLNCPIDPPDCCENVLFGCGTFDIPDGCSCSDYPFLSSKLHSLKEQKVRVASSATLAGMWRVALTKSSSSCSLAPQTAISTVRVRDAKGRFSIVVPGYGTLSGKSRKGSGEASGTYRIFGPKCTARVSARLATTGAKLNLEGTSVMTVNVNCPIQKLQCTAKYAGRVTKL
jgi:hypothetical protein